jgi:hypothetical protein
MLPVQDSVLLRQVCLESCLEYRIIQHMSVPLCISQRQYIFTGHGNAFRSPIVIMLWKK